MFYVFISTSNCHDDAMITSPQQVFPPSAPERTLQASGQGQATARLNGGLPCCSVPASTTRWAAKNISIKYFETGKPHLKNLCMISHHLAVLIRHYSAEL
jgi:hypothetical protein